MKFQIHSDIHLEKYPNRRIKTYCPNLILAGDIGVPIFSSYKRFFQETSKNFDRIFYVLGNHEYERCWMGIDKNNLQLMQQKFQERKNLIIDILSEFKNINLLDNKTLTVEKKTIHGTTLWTNFHQRKSQTPLTGPQLFLSGQHLLAVETYPVFTPNILITHYVSNKYALNKPWSIGLGPKEIFHSEISIFGHIHYPIFTTYEGQKIICNPWGESAENDPQFVNLD
jgi:predicted phosphodiesterase